MATSFFVNTFAGPQGWLIGGALILFFIVRQFTTRPVLSFLNVVAPAALLYFGLQGLGELDSTGWLLLGVSVSLAITLGAARGVTFHLSTDAQGQALMRGTVLTVVLWIATITAKAVLTWLEIRLGFGAEATTAAASLLPGAVTIAAQLLVVYLRAQDQRPAAYRVS
jgi:hypothetical protein